jgi:hypothetical protein
MLEREVLVIGNNALRLEKKGKNRGVKRQRSFTQQKFH